jgi:very-short-patch-repair endonuclease
MKGNCSLIKCQLCQQEMSFGRIKSHIKARHKEITVDQYIKQYWSTLPLHKPCEVCKENIVYKYKTCSKECHSTLISDQLKDKPKPKGFMSKEHIEKISQSHLGKIISKETGNKISKSSKGISRNKLRSSPMLGKKHSKSTIDKMSISAKISFDNGERPSIAQIGVKRSVETIEKIFKHRKINKLEKFVSYILDQNNIEYTNQFFIKTKEGICKSYDFKINNQNILLEIDGDYWHGGPSLNKYFYKLEEVKQNDLVKDQLAKDNNFILLRFWESDIYNQPNIIIDKIKELI